MTAPDGWERTRGTVVRGHGVASGRNRDPRFPGGTIALQSPAFRERGLDLARFHRGTINLDLSPRRLILVRPRATFRAVGWLAGYPAEDFSFADCRLVFEGIEHDGLVYHPHPESKPEHFQDPSIVEVLAPWIEGIATGATVELAVPPGQATLAPVDMDHDGGRTMRVP